jgi:hypothetical protein
MKKLKKNFYCGDEVDYGYIEAVINYKKLYEGEPLTQDVPIDAFINGAKWQQEQIGKSEFLQKLRATKSDAEARRLILEQFKKK